MKQKIVQMEAEKKADDANANPTGAQGSVEQPPKGKKGWFEQLATDLNDWIAGKD